MSIQSYTKRCTQEALMVFQPAAQESYYPDYSHRQIQAWCNIDKSSFLPD